MALLDLNRHGERRDSSKLFTELGLKHADI